MEVKKILEFLLVSIMKQSFREKSNPTSLYQEVQEISHWLFPGVFYRKNPGVEINPRRESLQFISCRWKTLLPFPEEAVRLRKSRSQGLRAGNYQHR